MIHFSNPSIVLSIDVTNQLIDVTDNTRYARLTRAKPLKPGEAPVVLRVTSRGARIVAGNRREQATVLAPRARNERRVVMAMA